MKKSYIRLIEKGKKALYFGPYGSYALAETDLEKSVANGKVECVSMLRIVRLATHLGDGSPRRVVRDRLWT